MLTLDNAAFILATPIAMQPTRHADPPTRVEEVEPRASTHRRGGRRPGGSNRLQHRTRCDRAPAPGHPRQRILGHAPGSRGNWSGNAQSRHGRRTVLMDQPLRLRTSEPARHAVTSPKTPGEPIRTHAKVRDTCHRQTARTHPHHTSANRLWEPLKLSAVDAPARGRPDRANDQCGNRRGSVHGESTVDSRAVSPTTSEHYQSTPVYSPVNQPRFRRLEKF